MDAENGAILRKPEEKTAVKKDLSENLKFLDKSFASSADYKTRIANNGEISLAFVSLDGMCDNLEIFQSVTAPVLLGQAKTRDAVAFFDAVVSRMSLSVQQEEVMVLEEAEQALIAGNALLFIDGIEKCLSFGVQGYPKKSISEPLSEVDERGSHEGFSDSWKDNLTLIRRRLKTPQLRLEKFSVGKSSNTVAIVCYLSDKVSDSMLSTVKRRLQKIDLDTVLACGYIIPFFSSPIPSLFGTVGITERPDVFCAKLAEGKIGILVDGAPQSIVVPYLFIEYFHSLDDYLKRPFYAFFLRMIKLISFLIATLLPGLYVAVGTFHPEMFPAEIIYQIAVAEHQTPFPLFLEAFIIHFIYEIVREAGLRMPKTMGHAVSIVGALIIGDAAVTAGLIAAPMLIIVALTAITSAVMSPIHDTLAVLRLVFIIAGGTLGIYGIMLGSAIVLFNISAQENMGVPFSAPFSPFSKSALRDTFSRIDWRKKNGRSFNINSLKRG